METTDSAIVLLTGTIFIALIIERLMEIIKSFYDYLEIKHHWYRKWNHYAQNIQQKLQYCLEVDKAFDFYLHIALWRLRVDGQAYQGVNSISAKKLRNIIIKYTINFFSVILGIITAFLADIDIFSLIDQMLHTTASSDVPQWINWARHLLTGIAMGFGAGPMHMIIASLEKAKRQRAEIW